MHRGTNVAGGTWLSTTGRACPIASDEWRPRPRPPCWVRTLPGRFQRIFGRCFVDVPALGAFEDSQIGTVATWFDAGQHHATLARRAGWPQYRNQRWFKTTISFGHVMLLPTWRERAAPPTADSSRIDGCAGASMARFAASHCSILLIFPENCRQVGQTCQTAFNRRHG